MAYNYGHPMFNPYYPQAGYQPAPTQSVPQQGNVNTQAVFACRPVTSKAEAEAVQVDFFGLGTIMPDLPHGVIYVKRFNPTTGSCDFQEFSATTADPVAQYATKEDIESLKEEIEKLKKGDKE